jgi:integrase
MGDITPAWLTNYENHELTKTRPSQKKDGKGKSRVGRMPNGVAIDLRNIRAAFNWAASNGWTDNYPFRRFKIHYEQTRKRDLSREQVRTIQNHGGRYCDTFMLMLFLIGINISDLYYLPKDCIRDGRLEYRRNKTGRLFSIKIEPEAQAIIDRYTGTDTLLSFAETCKDYKVFLHHMNKALDDLVKGCTSYWSRHTWASMAASLDIPIETVSRALGHSVGASVTAIYIHFDTRKVDEANRRVIDSLK